MTTAFGIFMMRSYFAALPKELEEAARVDGVSEIGIYFKIMLPLVKPGLMTLGIFHLMNNWNDLLYPLMMTSETNMRTLSAGLALFCRRACNAVLWSAACRGCNLYFAFADIIHFLPEVFCQQRRFIRN